MKGRILQMLDKLIGISAAIAEATTETAATTDAAAATTELSMGAQLVQLFVPMVLIIVVFYFFLIRPQRKKDKKVKE